MLEYQNLDDLINKKSRRNDKLKELEKELTRLTEKIEEITPFTSTMEDYHNLFKQYDTKMEELRQLL